MKANTFAASVLLAAMATAAPLSLQKRTSYTGGTTANDIENNVCAPVTLLFARGSTETATMGNSVGPALAKALISTFGAANVAVQGVDNYTASAESNTSLGADGGPSMAKLGQQAKSQCPSTKLVLSGYSQGAMVAHYAVGQGGLAVSDVAAVVLYGDPLQSQAVGTVPTNLVKRFCASGDGVCEGGGASISAAHLSYTSDGDIQTGADFVKSVIGAVSGGTSTASAPAGSASAAAPAPAATSAPAAAAPAPAPAATSAAAAASASGLAGLGSLFGGGSGSGSGSGFSGLSGFGSLFGGGSGTSTGSSTSSSGGLAALESLAAGSGSSGLGSFGSLGSSGSGSTGSSGLGSFGSLGSLGALSSGVPTA